MTIYLNPVDRENAKQTEILAQVQEKMKENWERLLEVILQDSTLDEILAFASRLDEIPRYTQEEEYARNYIRNGYIMRRQLQWELLEYGQVGYVWEDHTEEPVTLLELPQGLIEKGSKSWKIKI
jgi:hypothetical protein